MGNHVLYECFGALVCVARRCCVLAVRTAYCWQKSCGSRAHACKSWLRRFHQYIYRTRFIRCARLKSLVFSSWKIRNAFLISEVILQNTALTKRIQRWIVRIYIIVRMSRQLRRLFVYDRWRIKSVGDFWQIQNGNVPRLLLDNDLAGNETLHSLRQT